MAPNDARQQLNQFLFTCYNQGILDRQIEQVLDLEAENPGVSLEAFNHFCENAERIIPELQRLSGRPGLDYFLVDVDVHLLTGSSASLGAQQVRNACYALRQAFESDDRDGARRALAALTDGYHTARGRLETAIQLHQRIGTNSGTQQVQQPRPPRRSSSRSSRNK